MKDLVIDDLQIDMTSTPGELRLDWQGSSHLQNPQALVSFLDQVLRDVLASRAVIALHFERLAYFNSTTMVAVIRFIRNLSNQDIRVHISYDASSRLQRLFADTLGIFDKKDGRFLLQSL